MEEKVCSDSKCYWTDCQFYFGIFKYLIFNVLRLLFCVTAYLMRKTSSIFEKLSEKFNVVENLEIIEHEQSNEESPGSNITIETTVDQNMKTNEDIIYLNSELKDNEETTNQGIESEEILKLISVKETLINQDVEKKENNSLPAGKLDDTNDKIEKNVETLVNKNNSSTETDNNENINIKKGNDEPRTTIEKNNLSSESKTTSPSRNEQNLKMNTIRYINKTLKETEEANNRINNKILKKNEEANKNLVLEAKSKQTDKSLINASRLRDKSPNNYKLENPSYDRYESNRRECKTWQKHRSERISSSEHNCNNSKDPFCKNTRNQKDVLEKRENRGRRPISSTSSRNEKSIEISEVQNDIFNMPSTHALARFITEDLQLTYDTALDFKYKYKCSYGELLDQHLKVGDVGVTKNNDQYIFFLTIKKKFEEKLHYTDLERTLLNLSDKMKLLKLTKLAIFFSSGVQRLTLTDIKMFFNKTFSGTNISINICLIPAKGEVKHLPMIQRTNKNLWDMEPQTDIIMLINMEEMYNEHWHDEVVEKIDAKYPFKEQLMNDINIKPMAPGEILVYKINGEVLICVFVKSVEKDRDHYKSLEKAFNLIKTQLSGYRFLGLQQRSANSEDEFDVMSHQIILLRSVFNNQNAEVWLCGDNDLYKAMQYEQYQRIVKESIEVNKIGYTEEENLKLSHSNFKRDGVNSTGIVQVSLQHNGAINTPDTSISPIIKTCIDGQELNLNNNTTEK